MRDLNTILRDIQARADSLAIFAQHAAALDSTVSTRKSGYVENVIDTLRILDCLKVDLLDLVRAEQARTNTQAYTNLHGKCIVPPRMDWLEDGHYWQCDENGGSYYHDYGMDSGDYRACSCYCIGIDPTSGASIKVWLNCDMQEVEV
ncbi:hypothetical protein [Thiothrix subterranea]|uniref:Uncharacterized protein n=1 Tax=Thiothrix subterranea TaxID=2735563 RepID=A0AA51MRI9_9GAMM|nr:hypothetical protein [Thiothrix subterranea]MDQ5769569.1 hypothetical protein [Thiothrix subterranea]WML87152.1 hypothetical protein RCG00_02065 [Thiothrix subterranea]